jgi:hypothetical protein
MINPTTGIPYPPDKLGKDNNSGGLTIFKNTLYVTKGSGGNGINTVYRVGGRGSVSTLANAASMAITILPGLPTTLAKNANAANPFGISPMTTLSTSPMKEMAAPPMLPPARTPARRNESSQRNLDAGLCPKKRAQSGQPYTILNYPTSLNPATDGLRNIAGKVNADGTVSIWAITSTVSANGDQGADPNQLVAITDML